VRDGLAEDVDSQVTRSALFANWDAFVDPDGHPVIYEWSIGTTPGGTDVLPWTGVAGSTHAATSDLELPLGIALHVNVRAIDIAGNRSAISSSDGVVLGAPGLPTIGNDTGATAAGTAPPLGHLAAVDRHGVTWTFDKPVACGRFANGDWWVVGPVDIVAIHPACRVDGDRVRHGSMLDPDPTATTQGYDSGTPTDGRHGAYEAARNVGLGVSRQQPLRLAAGRSLVSAISHPMPGQSPQLESAAVLTCLAEPPPPNAFRPPYCAGDKSCRWTADRLDFGRLQDLEAVAQAPRLTDLAERLAPTWLDHLGGRAGANLHPRGSMPTFGRDLADLVGLAGLALHLERPRDEKRTLAIPLVQFGLDVYGIVRAGGRFVADGGNGAGRKFPLLLAGTLLHDDDLLRACRQHSLAFAEDVQTFVVAETAPGVVNHGHGGYGKEDIGLSDWGQRHADDPSLDDKTWTGDPYRRCCTVNAWLGFVLATRLLGQQEAWGHPPLFEYVDRYLQVEPRGSWMRAFQPFAERMWDRYRAEF
jgi:hypothetical protein